MAYAQRRRPAVATTGEEQRASRWCALVEVLSGEAAVVLEAGRDHAVASHSSIMPVIMATFVLVRAAIVEPKLPCDIFAASSPASPCVAAHSVTRALCTC